MVESHHYHRCKVVWLKWAITYSYTSSMKNKQEQTKIFTVSRTSKEGKITKQKFQSAKPYLKVKKMHHTTRQGLMKQKNISQYTVLQRTSMKDMYERPAKCQADMGSTDSVLAKRKDGWRVSTFSNGSRKPSWLRRPVDKRHVQLTNSVFHLL